MSPDGRYLLFDEGSVVDLDSKTRISTDCQHADARFGPAQQVVCKTRDGHRITVLAPKYGAPKTFPYTGDALPAFDRYSDYLFWTESRSAGEELSAVLEIDTGEAQTLPGTIEDLPFGGREGIATTSTAGSGRLLRFQSWDLSKKHPIGAAYEADPSASVWSPDRRWHFAVNDLDGQFVVDVKTGTLRVVGAAAERYTRDANDLQPFSPDGRLVAVGAAPKGVRVVDVASGQARGALLAPGCERPVDVAWSPDGTTLVVGSDSAHVCAFDVGRAELTWSHELAVDSRVTYPWVTELLFTSDAQGIVAGTCDRLGSTRSSLAHLLRASTGALVRDLGSTMGIERSTGGDLVIGDDSTGATVIGPTLSVTSRGLPRRDGVETLGTDAKHERAVGFGGGRIVVWNVRTGEIVYEESAP